MRVVVAPAGEFAAVGARAVASAIREAAARSGDGRFSLALSGGDTPGPVHERLALEADLPWHAAQIFFADERAVPPDDPESNYWLARETLLDRVSVPGSHVHRMEAELRDLDAAARRYAAALPDRLDVLLLGIGADGHTASLFPGAPSLGETSHRVLAVSAPAGVEPNRRLTITPPVIEAARAIVMLVSGEAKADAVRRALDDDGDVASCPARLARAGTWILDADAAALLPARDR